MLNIPLNPPFFIHAVSGWAYHKSLKMKETEKQLEYIRFIEDETGIIYKGKTKQEASNYISENKDKIPNSFSTETSTETE